MSALAGNATGSTSWRQLKVLCPNCANPTPLHTPECLACGWPLTEKGIPIFLAETSAANHDELHDHTGHKKAQAAHFDESSDEDFEIERPHGAPSLYRFLLDEKFRLATDPIRDHLAGASALTVCGGSGMDAEYLRRIGASVVSSDLSLGAAIRTRSRSQRHDLEIVSIVADVEHLPFADRSVDAVVVHDGLHHLDDPYKGLAEMARVARRWVIVSEPAQAAATRVAIRFKLALEVEEAGNKVARIDHASAAEFLRQRGFAILRSRRYAMYYRHRPGIVFRVLSLPVVFPLVRAAFQAANAVFGRFGNKMVVIAERLDLAPVGDQEAGHPLGPYPLVRRDH